MKDEELIERCHEGECICDGCERRFMCWTTKRIFSDPTHQALYEAYIAEGFDHEAARTEVKDFIKRAILDAEIRERAKEHPLPIPDVPIPDVGEWHKRRAEWEPPQFPDYVEWAKGDIGRLPIEDARKEMRDLGKYFRSIISGKGKQ